MESFQSPLMTSSAMTTTSYVFSGWICWSFLAASSIGVLANSYGFFHVFRYFNVRKPVFLLILLDTLLSLLGCLVNSSLFVFFLLTRLTGTPIPNQYGTCIVYSLSFFYPAHVGLAFTALIAIFRYNSIMLMSFSNQPACEKSQKRIIAFVGIALASMDVIRITVHWWLHLPQAISHEICMRGPASLPLHTLTKVLLITPMLLPVLVTLVFDSLILKFLGGRQRQRSGSTASARLNNLATTASDSVHHHAMCVPIRATVASALFTLPFCILCVLVGCISHSNFTAEVLLILGIGVMVALRAPLTVAITYRHDQAQSKECRRRLRQERIRAFAQKERDELLLHHENGNHDTRVVLDGDARGEVTLTQMSTQSDVRRTKQLSLESNGNSEAVIRTVEAGPQGQCV